MGKAKIALKIAPKQAGDGCWFKKAIIIRQGGTKVVQKVHLICVQNGHHFTFGHQEQGHSVWLQTLH